MYDAFCCRYYLTANSCWHDGYQEYDWPASWKVDATSSGKCAAVSADGTGAPEQVSCFLCLKKYMLYFHLHCTHTN